MKESKFEIICERMKVWNNLSERMKVGNELDEMWDDILVFEYCTPDLLEETF